MDTPFNILLFLQYCSSKCHLTFFFLHETNFNEFYARWIQIKALPVSPFVYLRPLHFTPIISHFDQFALLLPPQNFQKGGYFHGFWNFTYGLRLSFVESAMELRTLDERKNIAEQEWLPFSLSFVRLGTRKSRRVKREIN